MATTLKAFDSVRRVEVDFDPRNRDHVEAFRMLCIGVPGEDGVMRKRMHPTLRFRIDQPFLDVQSMMMFRVGQTYADMVLG